MLLAHCWCMQIQNDDELNGGFEWIDDDLGLRPPPPPYPASDVAVISSKVLEGMSVVFLAFLNVSFWSYFRFSQVFFTGKRLGLLDNKIANTLTHQFNSCMPGELSMF